MLAIAAFAVACSAAPARPVPLLGGLDLSIAWSPGHPAVGATVTFTATAADNDGTVVYAKLCYGDGSCSAPDYPPVTGHDLLIACALGDNYTKKWTHPYPRAGSFPVTLTVTTRGCPGNDDETKSLTLSLQAG